MKHILLAGLFAAAMAHTGNSPSDCSTPRYCVFPTDGAQSSGMCGYSDREIKRAFLKSCDGKDCQKFMKQGSCFDPKKGLLQ